jgi:hypothetical protein
MIRAFGIALVLLAAQTDTCTSTGPSVDPCRAEPQPHFVAVIENQPGPDYRRHEAGVAFRRAARLDGGFIRLVFGLSNGDSIALRIRSPLNEWPLVAAGLYDVTVEFAGGSPSLSGLVIADADGVIAAGASDQRPGGRIFVGGGPLPNLALTLAPSGCAGRPAGDCYRSLVNQRLRVTHGEDALEMAHGESATIGGFRVTALAAQEVEYSNRCADAGLVAFSWFASRVTGP